EISIKRIVRKNGQSIYKINNETKTRQEILSLLALAGIDPNGFNIILQGEIQNFVQMHTEERRKIIEEVSGISIYELRKQKSLKELEKTEEKIKEALTILRERTAYLNNLERERQQALRFKKLEKNVKIFKASIIRHDLIKKKKEKEKIDLEILKRDKEKEKYKQEKLNLETEITNINSKINFINSTIQKSTGLEQEKLNQEIADLRAELTGMNVKLENYENRISDIERQKQELSQTISDNEVSIKKLQKESPSITARQKEIEIKKQELEKLEEQRKKFYMIKSELKSIKERLNDKNSVLQNYISESKFSLEQIRSFSTELFDKNTNSDKVDSLKFSLAEKKELLVNLNKREIKLEKISYANELEIEKQDKLIERISKMDTCPLCKSKMTEEHLSTIKKETIPKIDSLKKEVENSDRELSEVYHKRDLLKSTIEQVDSEISKRESDMIKLLNIDERKKQIKILYEKIEQSKEELSKLEKRKKTLEEKFDRDSNIEQKYEITRVEIQEVFLRNKENVNAEISSKLRELERSKILLKQFSRNKEDLNDELQEIKKNIKEKEKLLENKKQQEEKLSRKFRELISQKDSLQGKIKENELNISKKQNALLNIEQGINNFKLEKARIDAEIEGLEMEILEFPSIQIIKASKEFLLVKLNKTREILSRIGSVNLRSLEVYDSVKKEYDLIKEKIELINKEKQGVLRIIHAIDIKKKKTFVRTLNQLNEIFSRNFSQLSEKSRVSLGLENRKNPFDSGVEVIVKTGHGKYFDVRSLSGGEQTLVALSLIFAIQELKPYPFYILDEIDAALDKRNSARLAGLLNKYMKKGQYIVITHNDEIITNATNLYGISMHDGISKIISLKV
ncbi:hypothetical protein KAT80_00125, partial [Candidatus Pacearchaeota archaeon]|nr:hypothetical protein [Candidatus Pacearchaeota archaeon]